MKNTERKMYELVPLEIMEEVLLHLPIKSLLRFSSVSKSWRLAIFDRRFARRHGGRVGERLAIRGRVGESLAIGGRGHTNFSLCPLSSSISETLIKDAVEIVCPIKGEWTFLHAFCDELWCVQVEDSLFLWNPTSSAYRKLPDPPIAPWKSDIYRSVYGLGYYSAADDYKILQINRYPWDSELYSLRSDSWRRIPPSEAVNFLPKEIVFVDGAFYWIITCLDYMRVIVSFDLSTEKYDTVEQPAEYDPELNRYLQLTKLRGKLTLFGNYHSRFFLWVMEDKSWSKKFDIQYRDHAHCFFPKFSSFGIRNVKHRPVYYNDGGQILVQVSWGLSSGISDIIMYDEEGVPKKILHGYGDEVSEAFVCAESLVSPALWPESAAPAS